MRFYYFSKHFQVLLLLSGFLSFCFTKSDQEQQQQNGLNKNLEPLLPIKIDLSPASWNDHQMKQHIPVNSFNLKSTITILFFILQKVCKHIRSDATNILTLGLTEYRFLLISTDLFVYELNPKQVNSHLIPPYSILINRDPVHFSIRWPQTYPKIVALSNSILYSFVTKICQSNQEYVAFVYRSRSNNKTDSEGIYHS